MQRELSHLHHLHINSSNYTLIFSVTCEVYMVENGDGEKFFFFPLTHENVVFNKNSNKP